MKNRWELIDSLTATWTLDQGGIVMETKFSYYKIYYNEKLDSYKLICEGYRPKQTTVYREALRLLAAYNLNLVHKQEPPLDVVISKVLMGDTQRQQKQNRELLMKQRDKDSRLVEAMEKYKESLLNEFPDIEIFDHLDNLLFTDQGFFIATFGNQLSHDV